MKHFGVVGILDQSWLLTEWYLWEQIVILSQNMAWDCLLIAVFCTFCRPEIVLFDIQNNLRFKSHTKHKNQQTVSCNIMG